MKTGIANLPLHYGKAPAWLFGRMKKLAREITLIILEEHGHDIFLNKISDPFWFQAFGSVLGFDWHSSGLTTTVCGALKEGLKDVSHEIGLFVCGGKGATSRKTPQEIEDIGYRTGIDIDSKNLIYASRMSAKVDSTALQDGYQLYQHSFIFTKKGSWAVVQQGMNESSGWARRYHWIGNEFSDFVNEPHKAICCDNKHIVLNMVAEESKDCRSVCALLSREKPDKTVKEFENIKRLTLPKSHPVSLADIRKENFKKILEKTYEKKPENFEALIATQGVGPKTVRALSLISEIIYGKPASFRDPVRFSFAHGGKDGFPYPVNREQYDLSIEVLKNALNHAKIGNTEKIKAFKRLVEFYK